MTDGRARPRLGVVVAGAGAVTPLEAYLGLRSIVEPIFLVAHLDGAPPDPRSDPVLKRLSDRAEVTTTDAAADARLHGVTTFSADGVAVAGALAATLGLPPLAADAGEGLADKLVQRSTLGTDIGARFAALPSAAEDDDTLAAWSRTAAHIGLPAVLKPALGHASHGVAPIDDLAALAAAHRRLQRADLHGESGRWLLEERLTGHDQWPRAAYVSVETVVAGGRPHHVAVTRKLPLVPPFRELGQYLPPATDPDADEVEAAILEVTTTALDRLGVRHAVTHTELMLTSSGPRVLEVNGRIGGLVRDLVRRAYGADLVPVAAEVALGWAPTTLPGSRATLGGALVFQYAPLTPTTPGRFLEVVGLDDVLATPHLERYAAHVRPGDEVPGGTHTATLGVLSGTCADERELALAVQAIEAGLSYRFVANPDGAPTLHDPRGAPRPVSPAAR